MRTAETLEEAMAIVRSEKTECQVEWFSLGKRRLDLVEYLKTSALDTAGVFFSGDLAIPGKGKLTLMPNDWVDHEAPRVLRGSAQWNSIMNRQ